MEKRVSVTGQLAIGEKTNHQLQITARHSVLYNNPDMEPLILIRMAA
jgi:hypothetical protein